jgi:hypothetical protein
MSRQIRVLGGVEYTPFCNLPRDVLSAAVTSPARGLMAGRPSHRISDDGGKLGLSDKGYLHVFTIEELAFQHDKSSPTSRLCK